MAAVGQRQERQLHVERVEADRHLDETALHRAGTSAPAASWYVAVAVGVAAPTAGPAAISAACASVQSCWVPTMSERAASRAVAAEVCSAQNM